MTVETAENPVMLGEKFEIKNLLQTEMKDNKGLFSTLLELVGQAFGFEVGDNKFQQYITAASYLSLAAQIFDDLIDRDKPQSLAARWGDEKALVGGLAGWFIAQDYFWQAFGENSNASLLTWWQNGNRLNLRIAEQTFNELSQPFEQVAPEKCLERAALISGEYLENLVRGMALLGDIDVATVEKYASYAYKLGILYQIRNDLGSFFDEELTRNCFYRKQIILPVAYALNNNPSLLEELKMFWETEFPLFEQIKAIQKEVQIAGGILATLFTMRQIYDQISELLDPPNSADQALLKLAAKLLEPSKQEKTHD
jgi:geranylgeranyl pyrophosphate synthase